LRKYMECHTILLWFGYLSSPFCSVSQNT
jgi:hypothetical protein